MKFGINNYVYYHDNVVKIMATLKEKYPTKKTYYIVSFKDGSRKKVEEHDLRSIE